MKAMAISMSGMDVEWRRLEVIAENLANVNTVQTAAGGPYRPMRLLSGPRATFEGQLGEGQLATQQAALNGVTVYGLEAVEGEPRKVHEPGNPLADADGYVSYPAIDHSAEMVLMVKTARAYEANLVAMGSARQMYLKALEMGK